jgi:hypothetical protein
LKALYWLVGIILGIPLILVVLQYGASELGGEVVTLDRAEANGELSQVRIWIVDEGDTSWVEHQDPSAFWITRLADSPDITLNRGDETATYAGQPDPDKKSTPGLTRLLPFSQEILVSVRAYLFV